MYRCFRCHDLTFITLPVVALFLKSPLDTTLRSLHDPVVIFTKMSDSNVDNFVGWLESQYNHKNINHHQ